MLQNALAAVNNSEKKKYVDQLLKILRLLILNSSKNASNTVKQEEDEAIAEEESAFKTPVKQIKPSVPNIAISQFDITAEALFGDTLEAPDKVAPVNVTETVAT